MQVKKDEDLTLEEKSKYSGIIVWDNGSKLYFLNGQLHREDGPAVEGIDGYKAYYIHNKRHRLDGPAKIWPNGTLEWFIRDEAILVSSQEEFVQHLVQMAFE